MLVHLPMFLKRKKTRIKARSTITLQINIYILGFKINGKAES